jgi:hypothetical protein
MDCPKCKLEWKNPLILGLNYESFYFNLMAAPRKEEGVIGGTAEFFNAYAKFLCFGEQAPCGDIHAVYGLTPKETEWWVKEIMDVYEKQQKEMNKGKSKRR